MAPLLDYRARIYDHYVHARHTSLAPATLAALDANRPYLARVIREHFPPARDARVLDLGCGHGTLVYFARQAGYRNVAGVDRSPEQVAEANRLGIDGVREGDLMETLATLSDASQDIVIAFDVIEHFTRSELLPFVDQVHRVLAPGGKWIIHTPNAESPFFGRIRYGDFTHEQAYTSTSIGQLMLSSGFREVHCFEDAPVVHGVKSAVRYAIWRAIRGTLRVYLAAETGSPGSGILSQNFLTVAVK
ncbi:MAG: methyltransferase domain-containing protein [Gemmatimonadota bacterium]|nr:methyltransferase domain-containing protein [Gemmatimonadota bacterium]